MSPRLRRPGSRWRLLAHGWSRDPGTGKWVQDGRSYDVTSDPDAPANAEKLRRWFADRDNPDAALGPDVTVLENTILDEVVCGEWLHVEELDRGKWYVHVGGVHLTVHADRDGRPTSVFSEGVVDPRDGCTYELTGGWD